MLLGFIQEDVLSKSGSRWEDAHRLWPLCVYFRVHIPGETGWTASPKGPFPPPAGVRQLLLTPAPVPSLGRTITLGMPGSFYTVGPPAARAALILAASP